jgi:16S rRNA (cytidine1402-2'-O)-methyltransferase
VPTGTLYVLGTPIGNLGDLSSRAAETLAGADIVAAEDTRRTRTLLTHLGIRGKRLVKMDAHAERRSVDSLVRELAMGRTVVLATDAGTPGVSDPGAAMVRAAASAGARIIGIPGPSAVTTAAAVSGLVEGSFWFVGFLPRKGEKRRRLLAKIAASEDPVILFEAPSRVASTLADLAPMDPTRAVVVCRELTKVHEEIVRGEMGAVAGSLGEVRGEVTMVLGPAATPTPEDGPEEVDRLISERLAAGTSAKDVATAVSEITGRSRREIYARVLELRKTR